MKKTLGIIGKVFKMVWIVWSIFVTISIFPIVIAWRTMYSDTGRDVDDLRHDYIKGWTSFWDKRTSSNLGEYYGVEDDEYTIPNTKPEEKDNFEFGFH